MSYFNISKCSIALNILLLFITAPPLYSEISLGNDVVEWTLDNGMHFICLPRHQSPVFTAYIRFRVGGVDEHPGITGLAHFFEHMAFKGTQHIGTTDYKKEKPILEKIYQLASKMDEARKNNDDTSVKELRRQIESLYIEEKKFIIKDELWSAYMKHGSLGLNASTGKDMTSYYVSLPSNKLELWALLESDRMLSPVFREFHLERDVIREERRMRTDNDPGGKLYEAMLAASFEAHPYRLPVIGWESDISFLTVDEASKFFRTYYVPSNCTIVLSGDIDVGQLKRLSKSYFGRIPSMPRPPGVRTEEPPQDGIRRRVINFDAEPRVMMAWHKPVFPHPDAVALEVLSEILSDGLSSRLYKRMVVNDKIATSVYTYEFPGERYPNLFIFFASPVSVDAISSIEKSFDEELDNIKKHGVRERELEKIKNNQKSEFIKSLRSNDDMADLISYYACVTGDWKNMLLLLEERERVTSDDIKRVSLKYFNDDNKTVVILKRGEKK